MNFIIPMLESVQNHCEKDKYRNFKIRLPIRQPYLNLENVFYYNWVIHGIPGTNTIISIRKCSNFNEVNIIPGLPVTKCLNHRLGKVIGSCAFVKNIFEINFFQVTIFGALTTDKRQGALFAVNFAYKHISNYFSISLRKLILMR